MATTENGSITYYAWGELITSGVTVGNFTLTPAMAPVRPGDRITAYVEEVSDGVWQLEIEDTTQGWEAGTGTTFSLTFSDGESAEWITERPLTGKTGELSTLADFGSTRFHDLGINGGATETATYADYMHGTTGKLLAYPGPLSSATTDNFTNYYEVTSTPPPTEQTTTTSITSSKNPSVEGTAVTFTATVSPTTGAGTVTFRLTGDPIPGCLAESLALVSGTYRATCSTSSLPIGTDMIAATYTGDSHYAGSHDYLTEVVTAPSSYTRIFGSTADTTAAAELQHQFTADAGRCPGTPSTRPVVLATDAASSDALASAYLARVLGTGTLLTAPTVLSAPTLAAIHREGITKLYVVGGPLAVSAAVVDQLESTGVDACGGGVATGSADIKVTRIFGTTQYTTAEKIAENPSTSDVGAINIAGAYAPVNASGGGGRYNDTSGIASPAPVAPGALPTAILASGQEFQDAEAASTLSYARSVPILLTTPSALSAQASAAIATLGIEQVVVMGGPLAISNDVVSSLEGLGLSVLRVAGQSYSDTASQLADLEMGGAPTGLGWTGTGSVTIARGNGFTDGLAGAVVAADGPASADPEPLLLTVSPTTVGPALAAFLHSAGTSGIGGVKVSHFTILGGPLAITQTTINSMGADL